MSDLRGTASHSTHDARLPTRWLGAALATTLAAAGDVHADPLPVGDELQVHSFTPGTQFLAAVAPGAAADGSFLVVWTTDVGGEAGEDIDGQLFGPDGLPVGGELVVNSYTTESQLDPALAGRPDGSFVVVWNDFGDRDGSGNGVFGQRLDAGGGRIGDEFQVDVYTTGDQRQTDVAARSDGSFVVVWASGGLFFGEPGPDGSGFGVRLQRFSSLATPLGDELTVNSYTTQGQKAPAVATRPDGSFLVVWESGGNQDGDDRGIFGQRFGSDGSRSGGEFQVNSYTTRTQYYPDVAATTDGGFVVTWTSGSFSGPGPDGDGVAIRLQRISGDGELVGAEQAVNSYTTDEQFDPSIAASPHGGFVVAWTSGDAFGSGPDGDGRAVRGQLFSASSSPIGGEFQINSYTTDDQSRSSVAVTSGGDFVVAWSSSKQDPDDSAGVFAQRFQLDPFEGFPCSEAGVGIPAVEIPDADPTGIADDLEVSAAGRAFDLAVYLDIAHSFVDDLAVTLTNQSTGTAVALVDRPGVPALGSLGCSGDDMAIELRDGAETSVEDECGSPDAYPGSVYAPEEPLAAFDGETLAGTWRLEVVDSVSGDTGELRRWCLLPRALFADDFENGDTLAWSASVP